jgi:hypothetical protein
MDLTCPVRCAKGGCYISSIFSDLIYNKMEELWWTEFKKRLLPENISPRSSLYISYEHSRWFHAMTIWHFRIVYDILTLRWHNIFAEPFASLKINVDFISRGWKWRPGKLQESQLRVTSWRDHTELTLLHRTLRYIELYKIFASFVSIIISEPYQQH